MVVSILTVWVALYIEDPFLLPNYSWEEVEENMYEIGELVFSYVGVDEKLPSAFSISSPYPNPFNSSVAFNVNLDKTADVKLTIYNLLGREIDELTYSKLPAGRHTIKWNPEGISTGLYLYRIEVGTLGSKEGKLILLK